MILIMIIERFSTLCSYSNGDVSLYTTASGIFSWYTFLNLGRLNLDKHWLSLSTQAETSILDSWVAYCKLLYFRCRVWQPLEIAQVQARLSGYLSDTSNNHHYRLWLSLNPYVGALRGIPVPYRTSSVPAGTILSIGTSQENNLRVVTFERKGNKSVFYFLICFLISRWIVV